MAGHVGINSLDQNPYYGGGGPELAGWDPWLSQISGSEHVRLRMDDELSWKAEDTADDDHDHIVWRFDA